MPSAPTITDRIPRKMTLVETARRFGYNQRYLSEKLKRQTGLSFSDLAHEEQLKTACRLLENTDAPVTEIAHEVGYMDASSFYRMFMKRRGRTPLQHRKAHSGGNSFSP
jgi:AraC-like DNA-binding protein